MTEERPFLDGQLSRGERQEGVGEGNKYMGKNYDNKCKDGKLGFQIERRLAMSSPNPAVMKWLSLVE